MLHNGTVISESNPHELADLVERTISALDGVRLPLDMPGSRALEETRAQLATQLRTRILPHLQRQDLPAVVVLGGSSGAGKSTIFNSLAGEEMSPATVIRPTTRMPYIAVHPDDAEVMEGHALLDMGRVVNPANAISGVVLIDAPDLDSVDEANRELSRRLLDAADIWLFVTTSARYGDQMAWQMLRDAHRRGMTCAVLLNRVPERALDTVRRDIFERMNADGMSDTALMVVADAGPHEGLLDPMYVEEISMWLERIAATQMGQTLVDRTTEQMMPELRTQLQILSEAVEMQANAVQDLRDKVGLAAGLPFEKLETNASKGRYGQGAPTTSWLTFASTGGALETLAAGQKPSLLRRHAVGERDDAMKAVFESVVAAVRVGIAQAIIATEEEVWQLWGKDMIETDAYVEEGKTRLHLADLVEEAEEGWRADLRVMSQTIGDNPWLSREGIAALLGAAAGGINGAVTSLGYLGAGDSLIGARKKLVARCETAIEKATEAYTSVLDEIPIGNGRNLRLRAAEYAERF